MSELIDKLAEAGQQNKGTDLGGLLQWAMLHIKDLQKRVEQMEK